MTRNDYNPDLREDVTVGPAIGLLELCSVARGVEVADAILWELSLIHISEPTRQAEIS